jgi:hypothetical protein
MAPKTDKYLTDIAFNGCLFRQLFLVDLREAVADS